MELNNVGEVRAFATKPRLDPPAVQTCRLNPRWFRRTEMDVLIAGRADQSSGNAKKFDGPRSVEHRARRRRLRGGS